jgi:formate hydrogenlyase transcriptional activator
MLSELEKEHLFAEITTEKAPLGIWWRDSTGKIVRANLEAARLLHYSRDGLIGMNITDIDAEFDAKRLRESWLKLREEGDRTLETVHLRKDGTRFPAAIKTVLFTFEEKEYACTFFRDVTEEREGERRLRRAVAQLAEVKRKLTRENVYLKEEIGRAYNYRKLLGDSRTLKELRQRVEQVAATRTTVLVRGETGTGKELVARAVHELSGRRSRSLVKVNCAALPATFLESELFGHEEEAFAGAAAARVGKLELADQGTIFLDEIGDLPLPLQGKLLRFFEDGELVRRGSGQARRVDVRVVAATSRNLEKLMDDGRFRIDLYYRLNVFSILCPPLRPPFHQRVCR